MREVQAIQVRGIPIMETQIAYVIRSLKERDADTELPLYWNNRDGWVSREDADEFSILEMRSFRLPIGGTWEEAI